MTSQNSSVEVPTLFGEGVSKEGIKIKGAHMGGPSSNLAVLIRDAEGTDACAQRRKAT